MYLVYHAIKKIQVTFEFQGAAAIILRLQDKAPSVLGQADRTLSPFPPTAVTSLAGSLFPLDGEDPAHLVRFVEHPRSCAQITPGPPPHTAKTETETLTMSFLINNSKRHFSGEGCLFKGTRPTVSQKSNQLKSE